MFRPVQYSTDLRAPRRLSLVHDLSRKSRAPDRRPKPSAAERKFLGNQVPQQYPAAQHKRCWVVDVLKCLGGETQRTEGTGLSADLHCPLLRHGFCAMNIFVQK